MQIRRIVKAAFGGMMRNVLSWILVLTLTLSPLLAQEAQTPKLKINNSAEHFDNTLLGNSILMSLPSRSAAAAMPAMPSSNDSPGKNKSIIIGILILAGVTTAVILLWPSGHDKKPVPVAAPVTPVPSSTILAAGTPNVNTPNQ